MTKVKLIYAAYTDQSDAASTTASNYPVWNWPEAVSKISCSFQRMLLPAHAHPPDQFIRSIRVDLLLLLVQLSLFSSI